MTTETIAASPLADYLPDAEMARLRGVTSRTQRAERQRGDGPPWVKDGRRVLYPVKGYSEYLASNVRRPVRSGR